MGRTVVPTGSGRCVARRSVTHEEGNNKLSRTTLHLNTDTHIHKPQTINSDRHKLGHRFQPESKSKTEMVIRTGKYLCESDKVK